MKTTQIEVREVLGDYDDKIKIYREPDNTIVIQTDTGTVKIKDGTITLSGSLKIDGLNIGTTESPSLITLEPPALWLLGQMFVSTVISAGYADTWGVIYVNDAFGLPTISLIGSSGDARIKGGLNLGTATEAAPGQLKASDSGFFFKALNIGSSTNASQDQLKLEESSGKYITLTPYSTYSTLITNIDFLTQRIGGAITKFFADQFKVYGAGLNVGPSTIAVSEGDAKIQGGLNVGTATAATQGQIKASASIETPDSNVLGKTLQLQFQYLGPPAASAAYRGQFHLYMNPLMGYRDELYICVKDADAETYTWRMVDIGY